MIKAIILIGRTGSGKSTLANVISGTNKFKESGSSVSETKDIQSEEFKSNNTIYRVVDTVGIGDTKLTKEEVLDKIAEAVYLARDGVSQVLFSIDGRFDQYEMSIYNLLKTIIFDKNITNYTTITRTNFNNFKKEKKCQKDVDLIIKKGGELAKIIESCQGRVIHVDNPSLEVIGDTDKLNRNKNKREESRKILLEHLGKYCQEDSYKPPKLQSLSEAIIKYMEENLKTKEKLENESQNFTKVAYERKKVLKKLETKKAIGNQNITKVESNKTNNSTENNKTKLNIKKEKQIDNEQEPESSENEIDFFKIVRLEITILGDEIKELKNIKRLKKDIQKLEENIRQAVREHILNSCDDIISSIQEGEAFINLIKGNNDAGSYSEQGFSELQKRKKACEKECQKRGYGNQSLDKVESEIKVKKKN